jgi:hypothetical protein
LILLNGPPASGKSTLARRYGVDHPLALALDIDVVRSLLGGWLEHPDAAGMAARAMALAMAREHLRAGRDVVVPSSSRVRSCRSSWSCSPVTWTLSSWRSSWTSTRTSCSPASSGALPRAAEVSTTTPAALLRRGGGTPELLTMRAQMLAMLAHRPRARFLTSREGDPEGPTGASCESSAAISTTSATPILTVLACHDTVMQACEREDRRGAGRTVAAEEVGGAVRIVEIITWVMLPTVMFGGAALLGMLTRSDPPRTPWQLTMFAPDTPMQG